MKKFRMTNTELKLKRERMVAAFKAGKAALDELRLPYFLAYGSALGALREGQFQPYEDDINVGVYSWDLASLQLGCTEATPLARDRRIIAAFDRLGFEPVSELSESQAELPAENRTNNACPRVFLAEGWRERMAFPILYKFTHRESFVRFDMIVFTMQFGQLWDFADGGAETSSGWRYVPFAPQPVEFEKLMTFTMPPEALKEHYGQDWHVPRVTGYIDNLSRCENRCQVLRVHPFDVNMGKKELPPSKSWEEFRPEMRQYRMRYAEAMGDSLHEFPPQKLDLYKIESKPMVLFQAAGICKSDGNDRLKRGNASGALDKYEEGLYIMDKCSEVLTTWRLIFRQIHNEKAEKDRKERNLKYADMVEAPMPDEFRGDERDQDNIRITLLLNASQAALQCQRWDAVERHATNAIQLDSRNVKALYRRAQGRLGEGRKKAAEADFWAMLKASNFESKEALAQLMKLVPKDDLQRQLKKAKNETQKDRKLGEMLTEMDEDERIAMQDERYQRYLSDCEQRRFDKQKELAFDDWVKQYEWRYDADERAKARAAWPDCFSHMGPAPLPVEDWEVDYLTHKEVDKIVYHRQTHVMAAKKREKEGPKPAEPEKEGFNCQLQLDKEDMKVLKEAVVQRGYHYWW